MSKEPERNEPCHCGSGKKFKNCCQKKKDSQQLSKAGITGIIVAGLIALLILGLLLFGGDSQKCPPGMTWSTTHQHCH